MLRALWAYDMGNGSGKEPGRTAGASSDGHQHGCGHDQNAGHRIKIGFWIHRPYPSEAYRRGTPLREARPVQLRVSDMYLKYFWIRLASQRSLKQEVIRKLPLAVISDTLLFDEDERRPSDTLRLQFEALP